MAVLLINQLIGDNINVADINRGRHINQFYLEFYSGNVQLQLYRFALRRFYPGVGVFRQFISIPIKKAIDRVTL